MKEHLISESASIVEALNALNALSGAGMTLFVVNAEGRLQGSVTDGDIRRALLSGHTLQDKIDGICRRDCLKIERGRYDPEILSLARSKGISLLPEVEDNLIINLIDLHAQRGFIPADAVLMAGGMGERLRPLTLSTPKPLLPVGGTPIIDRNIDLLKQFGVDNIFVTVRYLKDKIISHIAESGTNVKCISEPTQLGTIGSLALIPDFKSDDIVVMNADILTDINLEEMYLKHADTGAALTMAVVPYTVSVPFAIVNHKEDRVTGIEEKPTYNYLANAGIYMIHRDVIEFIEKGKRLDAPEFIEILLKENRKVSYYTVKGRWIDIGSPDDYRHACELLS